MAFISEPWDAGCWVMADLGNGRAQGVQEDARHFPAGRASSPSQDMPSLVTDAEEDRGHNPFQRAVLVN